MTTETANRVALLVGKALYSAAVCCSLLIGAVVVVPFYAYGIRPQAAGDVQAFDVKEYRPFGFEGSGALVHDIGVLLAFVGPLVIPATIIWGLLRFFGAQQAYLMNWRAIIAWHLD